MHPGPIPGAPSGIRAPPWCEALSVAIFSNFPMQVSALFKVFGVNFIVVQLSAVAKTEFTLDLTCIFSCLHLQRLNKATSKET